VNHATTLHLVRRPDPLTAGSAGPARDRRREASAELGQDGDLGDLALTAAIVAICAMPLLGEVAHAGSWSPGELGLGTAGALFAGRELWACARAALRARRRP
jgi:hypothetical protein